MALVEAWKGDDAGLGRMLLPETRVETPIWSCASARDYLDELAGACRFFTNAGRTPPALAVLSTGVVRPGVAKVQWSLGVEWPSAWRSRVNLLAESELLLESGGGGGGGPRVRAIKETWHEAPLDVFGRQVTPRLRDLVSLWNSPTAEHVPMWTERTTDDYRVLRVPPMVAVQAEWVETQTLLLAEQAPLPPEFAFTGEVKRSEWYSCVAPSLLERGRLSQQLPGNMRQVAQRRRWVLPLPAALACLPAAELPSPDGGSGGTRPEGVTSQSVQYVRRPSMRLAARSIRGLPSNKAVLSAARELAAAAERDGLTVVRQEGQPVVVQMCYDAKIGWNKRAQVSMAVWLSMPPLLQDNQVGVLLDVPCTPVPLPMIDAGGASGSDGS